MSVSVYNGRSRYDRRTVVGLAKNVADNEPAPLTSSANSVRPPDPVAGFVVGHHHADGEGTVTITVGRCELNLVDARRAVLLLIRHIDLACIDTEAAA